MSDYKPFCVLCDIDNVIILPDRSINIVLANLLLSLPYEIVFVTCRPKTIQKQTEKILADLGFKGGLIMRDLLDDRPHWKIKQDMIPQIQKRYNILFALDDKNSIIKMYRKNKINCLQVNFENYQFC